MQVANKCSRKAGEIVAFNTNKQHAAGSVHLCLIVCHSSSFLIRRIRHGRPRTPTIDIASVARSSARAHLCLSAERPDDSPLAEARNSPILYLRCDTGLQRWISWLP